MAEADVRFIKTARKKIIIGVIVAIVVLCAIVIPFAVTSQANLPQNSNATAPSTTTSSVATTQPTSPPLTNAPTCASVQDNQRFDCFPDTAKASRNLCQARGCCWIPTNTPMAPSCFFPPNYQSFTAVEQNATYGRSFLLTRHSSMTTHYGSPVNRLRLQIQYQTANRLRIKFSDADSTRYEVPIPLPKMNLQDQAAKDPIYSVEVNMDPFSLVVKRKSTDTVILDTSHGGFIFEDQLLQISSSVPSKYLYGLGEHEHESLLHQNWNWHRWGMFSRDEFPGPNRNLYGVHPMYLNIEDDAANSHAILLLNSNAMEAVLTPMPGITWRTIGGVLDFYVFLGSTPSEAVSQYINAIGLPYFPPYWALGFQLCRWGYNSLDRVKQVVDDMRNADIPQDIQYGDIDYMSDQLDFTWNKTSYAGLPEFVQDLHQRGQHYIIILDPAIGASQPAGSYPPYEDGKAKDIFIRHGDGRPMFGKVWPPGNAAFPDYTNSTTHTWWQNHIVDFHRNVSFDGLWIDMNEPANFVQGSVEGCTNNQYNNPPYKPAALFGDKLYNKTLCMDGKQAWGVHYNVHSLYGFSEMEPTLKACRAATGKRGIVISRSTYVSGGRFGGHWLGDNYSGWKSMTNSIIGALEFNMFGIPYIGADICGFFDNATASLCNRWMQLGAFYTFSRNHNGYGFKPQHPPAFGAKNAANARSVLLIRYKLLPYLYTLFYHANTHGLTVMRSLMMEFPKDKIARTVSKQFMWGSGLLITPVLVENATSVRGYFPNDRWFDFYTGVEMQGGSGGASVNVSLSAPTDFIPLHIRGGHILPIQHPANTTVYSRQNQFALMVALTKENYAEGSLFWDDGESTDTMTNDKHTLIHYNATKDTLTATVATNGYSIGPTLDYITIYGVNVPNIVSTTINGAFCAHNWDDSTKVLNITGLNHNMNQRIVVKYQANL